MLPLSFWFSDKNGPNGRNRPGMVWINRLAQHKTAVYGQECYEAMHKLNPFNLFARFTSKNARRDMEYLGHEIEVQIKQMFYNLPQSQSRYAEAEAMLRGYDGLFSRYTKEGLYNEMLIVRPEAIHWVNRNRADLIKFHEEHGKS